jgi:hypothetical protein
MPQAYADAFDNMELAAFRQYRNQWFQTYSFL